MSKLDKLKSLIPLEEIEPKAMQQIYNALEQSFLKKLAIMPDVHAGYDLPIGGVALLDNVISPSFVGFDIGCGVLSVNTCIKHSELSNEDKVRLYNDIKNNIPNGEGNEQKRKLIYADFPNSTKDKNLFEKVQSKITSQLGTLGGGNHFIELGIDEEEYIHLTIHSGSRNPGHTVGGYYMKLSETNDTDLPPGFFHRDSELGQCYLHDMNFMLNFALNNRIYMMQTILEILKFKKDDIRNIVYINENHNHAEIKADGVLHRKGATPANKGEYGVIPGNMRDGVFITVGLGNEEYLSSASHGAGRTMSRKKAKENINHETFISQLDGIVASTDKSLLDEAPDAYKDINRVIELQNGIVVNVVKHIKPIINVKGSGSIKPWEKKNG